MSTQPDTKAAPKVPMLAGAALAPINPTSFDEVTRLAKLAVAAGMFAAKAGADESETDKEARETQAIARATMAIMQGLEVGIPAMQAVQNIAIINGKAMIYGDLLTAVLWRQGFKIKKWTEGDGDKRVGRAEIIRPDGTVITNAFSVAQAKQARLWDTREKIRKRRKDGEFYDALNDAVWFRFPDRMLEWRAFGFCVKDGASDAARGMLVYEEAAPEHNTPIDITPAPMGHNRGPALDLEIPTMGAAQAAPEPQLSDKQWLAAFRHSAEMTRGIGLDQGFWDAHREEIETRGLQQECADIIAELQGEKADTEPDTDTDGDAQSDLEIPDGIGADEPDKQPDIDPQVQRRLAKFEKDMAMCQHPTRLRERRNAEQAYITVLSKTDQARFDAAFAQALARVKTVQAQLRR